MYLDGNRDNVTFRAENCRFEGNFCAFNGYGEGGGAIYAQNAAWSW